jgi:hypothetical protein
MDFWNRVGMIIIIFTLISGVKFLSEITKSITKLNDRLAQIVERVEDNDARLNQIETFLFE